MQPVKPVYSDEQDISGGRMHKPFAGYALRNGVRGSIVTALIPAALAFLALAHTARAETAVERGAYLVNTIMACGNCHSPRDADGALMSDKAFSGGITITSPAFVATAPNITQDRETGIGDWSDAEIKRALVEGVRPDHGHLPGVTLAAVMPASFYKALVPEDLDAIVAYLRTVKAVRNTVSEPEYKMPVHREPYPDAEKGFAKSDFSDSVRRGAYLVTIGHCMECHSTWSAGISDFRDGLGHGGRPFGPKVVKGLPRSSCRTSPRTPSPGSAPGAMRRSRARSVRALRATATASTRRWPIRFMRV
jgi:mono/diheme cytochrome c family protein